MIGIGRVAVTDDSRSNQMIQVQILPDQIIEVRRVGQYGHASVAPAGSDALVIFMAGDRQNGVVIGLENQEARPKELQPGESALYDDQGQIIYITRDGIVIKGAGKPVTIQDTPLVMIDSDLMVTGNITDLDGAHGTLADLRDAHNSHHHDVAGVATGASTISSSTPDETV